MPMFSILLPLPAKGTSRRTLRPRLGGTPKVQCPGGWQWCNGSSLGPSIAPDTARRGRLYTSPRWRDSNNTIAIRAPITNLRFLPPPAHTCHATAADLCLSAKVPLAATSNTWGGVGVGAGMESAEAVRGFESSSGGVYPAGPIIHPPSLSLIPKILSTKIPLSPPSPGAKYLRQRVCGRCLYCLWGLTLFHNFVCNFA